MVPDVAPVEFQNGSAGDFRPQMPLKKWGKLRFSKTGKKLGFALLFSRLSFPHIKASWYNGKKFLSRKKQSEAQLFSCFGESKLSPFFQWHLRTKTPRCGRLKLNWSYVRDHDSHLGMCLGHLLAKYGCSRAYSFSRRIDSIRKGSFQAGLENFSTKIKF